MNTDISKNISSGVSKVKGYVPGEQPQTTDWVKLNTNEFPYPPSPKVREAIIEQLGADGAPLRLYPSPESAKLREAVAEYFGLGREYAFAANGSDDILNLAIRAFSDTSKSVAALQPSYSLYPVLAKIQDASFTQIPFNADMSIPYEKIFASSANIFFFTNPNAPTGIGFPEEAVRKIVEGANAIVLVDEAYAPFSDWSAAGLVKEYDNLIVTGTSSKGWGLAGMRIGWGVASPKIIEVLDRVRDSYNLDRLAQAAGVAALKDRAYYGRMRALVVEQRRLFEEFLDEMGWRYFKSSANFVLFEPANARGERGANVAKSLFEFLKGMKILPRYFPNEKRIESYLRLTIGTAEQIAAVKDAARKWAQL